MKTTAFALCALTLTSLADCTCTLDHEKIESHIREKVKERGVTLKSITCPKDRKIAAGDKFECDIEADNGEKGKVAVEQTDDKGSIKWEVTSGDGDKHPSGN